MITMYDSIDVNNIPSNANAVAGYVGGRWPTYIQLVHKFPHAHKLSIAVNVSEDAECLDIEKGDAQIGDAYHWYTRQVKRGVWKPCFYLSSGTVPMLKTSLDGHGLPRACYRIWSAHYTGIAHIEINSDGTQWTDKYGGHDVDVSLIGDNFFGGVPIPPARAKAVVDARVTYDPVTRAWAIHPE